MRTAFSGLPIASDAAKKPGKTSGQSSAQNDEINLPNNHSSTRVQPILNPTVESTAQARPRFFLMASQPTAKLSTIRKLAPWSAESLTGIQAQPWNKDEGRQTMIRQYNAVRALWHVWKTDSRLSSPLVFSALPIVKLRIGFS